jgi:hypothetical protein
MGLEPAPEGGNETVRKNLESILKTTIEEDDA